MKDTPLVRGLALLYGLTLLAACRLYRLERTLDPANAEFLSQVNWIVTGQERKEFLTLPAAERPAFIEAFWRHRDPDPYTEENEFKVEYEKRLAEAVRLFRSENKPGWLTERGRILILFGPPLDRLTHPAGSGPGTACYEEWLYGSFPVLFVDRDCSGDYRLETHDLSSLRDINLTYLHELSRAQDAGLSTAGRQGRLFDFDADLQVTTRTPERLAGSVNLRIPLDSLTRGARGELSHYVLDVWIAFYGREGWVVWESLSSPELEMKIADPNSDKKAVFHSLQLPFAVEGPDKVSQLVPDKSFLEVTVTVRADGRTQEKRLDLK